MADDDDDDRRGSDMPAALPRGMAEQRAFDALEKDIKEVCKLSIFSYKRNIKTSASSLKYNVK
jgi:hypothetical protein